MIDDPSTEDLASQIRKTLDVSGALAALEKATAILREQPLFYLEYSPRGASGVDQMYTILKGALALGDYRAASELGNTRDVNSAEALQCLSRLSISDADAIFFSEFLGNATAATHADLTIRRYCTYVLPNIEAVGDHLRGRLETLNAAITRLFSESAESRRYHRYEITRSLIDKRDDANAAWMLSEYPHDVMEAPNGWAVFYHVASRADDPKMVDRAQSALVRFIVKNTSDRLWEDLRPVLDDCLNDFLESAMHRGWGGELESLQGDRMTWRAGNYRDALVECLAVEDAMGPAFERERYDELTRNLGVASRCATRYSETQLGEIRALSEKLGIRATTLRIAQLKASGKSLEKVVELAEGFLDELPLEVLYEANVAAVQKWLGDAWQDLHKRTQNYLPKAEAVLDFLVRAKEKELSPFVLEYCRALENELGQKAFVGFVSEVGGQLTQEMFASAKNYQPAKKKTPPAEHFAEKVEKGKPLTLGDWAWVIGLCKPGGETRRHVELVGRFAEYLETRFSPEVVDPAFAARLEKLRVLRNNAAHPRGTSPEDAEFVRGEVRDVLAKWLQFYREARRLL